MKTIGTTHGNILVSMSEEELATITGKGVYDDDIKKAKNGVNMEFDIYGSVGNIRKIKQVPTELKMLKGKIQECLKTVDEALTGINQIDAVIAKKGK